MKQMIAKSAQCRTAADSKGRDYDYPRDRPQKYENSLGKSADMGFRKRILAELDGAPYGLGLGQTDSFISQCARRWWPSWAKPGLPMDHRLRVVSPRTVARVNPGQARA